MLWLTSGLQLIYPVRAECNSNGESRSADTIFNLVMLRESTVGEQNEIWPSLHSCKTRASPAK